MRREEHVNSVGEITNAYKILVEIPEGKGDRIAQWYSAGLRAG
jgi:hypothetical protein